MGVTNLRAKLSRTVTPSKLVRRVEAACLDAPISLKSLTQKKGKRIEFTSPSSAAHVGWLIASYDVANAAKIGLTSDSEQSPRFTAEGITSQDKSITAINAQDIVRKGSLIKTLLVGTPRAPIQYRSS
ncbi:hypothetical protein Fcan01_23139 [Folsomia candida]|uniref:Uncharacterized protein n=1 Tax=Folsomia candida TaxID=158441 RepID=A0A226DAD5_FOLCA|nr:hypothetical protein Fcan01_23139 [Folsomia candida]